MVGKAVLLLLAGALIAVGWSRHEDRIHEQDRLAAVASKLVGHEVGVRCPNIFKKLVSVSGDAGTVKFDEQGRPANHTDLAPETCDALGDMHKVSFACLETATCGHRQWRVAWAIHTLAHESFHLRGIATESVAECYAMQTSARVAVDLGMPRRRARQLQRWLWVKGYPNEPTEYSTPSCTDGGPLDLHPGLPAWP
jgi:hypothetical protein